MITFMSGISYIIHYSRSESTQHNTDRSVHRTVRKHAKRNMQSTYLHTPARRNGVLRRIMLAACILRPADVLASEHTVKVC